MGRLSAFLSYRTGDQARVAAAAALLVVLPPTLVAAPFARLRRLLLRLAGSAATRIPGDPTPARVVSAVEVTDRALPGSRSCLERSLTAETLLRLYSYAPDHRIGVATTPDGDLRAHSWLELDGEVVIGDLEELDRYEPLPSLDRGDDP